MKVIVLVLVKIISAHAKAHGKLSHGELSQGSCHREAVESFCQYAGCCPGTTTSSARIDI